MADRFIIIGGVKIDLPTNPREREVAMKYVAQGWHPMRAGWPDFLMVRDGEVIAVEVKAQSQKKSRSGGLTEGQQIMKKYLSRVMRCVVEYSDATEESAPEDVKFSVVKNDTQPVEKRALKPRVDRLRDCVQAEDSVLRMFSGEFTIHDVISLAKPDGASVWNRDKVGKVVMKRWIQEGKVTVIAERQGRTPARYKASRPVKSVDEIVDEF